LIDNPNLATVETSHTLVAQLAQTRWSCETLLLRDGYSSRLDRQGARHNSKQHERTMLSVTIVATKLPWRTLIGSAKYTLAFGRLARLAHSFAASVRVTAALDYSPDSGVALMQRYRCASRRGPHVHPEIHRQKGHHQCHVTQPVAGSMMAKAISLLSRQTT
jgi:hypothetical protein